VNSEVKAEFAWPVILKVRRAIFAQEGESKTLRGS
jgi:hypothetical protein